MMCFSELRKSIFFVLRKRKGEQFCVELAHLMPLAVVLRSGVAPQRCPLSYTAAKISKVLETTKTFADYFVKMQKVSH